VIRRRGNQRRHVFVALAVRVAFVPRATEQDLLHFWGLDFGERPGYWQAVFTEAANLEDEAPRLSCIPQPRFFLKGAAVTETDGEATAAVKRVLATCDWWG